MSFTEQIITIAAVVAGTMLTRFLPFILFPANKKTPPLVAFLGKMLPAAVMGMLVVYSLKDTQIMTGSHGLPEAIAVPAGNTAQSAADDSSKHNWLHAPGAMVLSIVLRKFIQTS